MAIKGKSRSRGAKGVSRGPKLAYVPVKVPLLRRRGVVLAVGGVLGVAAIAGIVYGVVQQRNEERARDELDRMATAVVEYRGQIDSVLLTVGQPVPPASFDAFPQLAAAIGGMEAEDVPEATLEQATAAAEATAEAASDASGLFDEIPAADLVRGKDLPRDFNLYVIDSQAGFGFAMDLYRQAGLLLSAAAETDEGPARDELVARASEVHDLAEEAFASAYIDYVEAQTRAQVFQPSEGAVPTLPIQTGPTGSTAAP
ncbi:MAG: hypothetical protein ACXWYC_07485 [Actinomycetota bacterium]